MGQFIYAHKVTQYSHGNIRSLTLTFKDNTPVKLQGQVVKSLGDEKYQFRDKTGVITVDIDDELWQGRPVSPTTYITLIGEVDIDYKPMKRVEIEADQIQF